MRYLLYWGGAYADITFEPSCIPGDVSIDTVEVEGITFHTVSVENFPLPMSGEYSAGLPSVPFTAQTFLLPPDIAIDTILITSASWDTLPGRYYLYPAQSGSMEDTTFAFPNSEVYASDDPFPSQPVTVTRQGTAMGYSVASLSGTPVRYIPADSLLMVLTSVTLNIQTCTSEFERIVPVRETEWSASVRERGILSLVANPSAIRCYQKPTVLSYRDRISPLNILDSPSLEGDGVDMVIITSGPNGSGPDLTSAFQELADYRTAQGIITVIRTVDWIDNLYSGCDIQEKIRNFIGDAHEQWGVQAVLLGGDDWIVPVREYSGDYRPSDDYYSDIDGDWSLLGNWRPPSDDYYVDLILGRWPVDNSDDVDLLLSKLKLYECPDEFPTDFARKALFIGGSAYSSLEGWGPVYEEYLKGLLDDANISGPGENLDEITELYFPQNGSHSCSPFGGNYRFNSQEPLERATALAELDAGYNLIIHMDHSGTHEIGVAQKATPAEYIYEYDFQSLSNTGEPSILWTAGCWPGHFEGADCFAEAGLLTSNETGLVAVIANARSGVWNDWKIYYPFVDALYPFGWVTEIPPTHVGGVSYIGEAYRYSMNFEHDDWGQPNHHKSMQNLFGDPVMFVWRDDPHQLAVAAVPSAIYAGTSTDITVYVTDADAFIQPLAAKVCLYKDGDLFAIKYTDGVYGTVTFNDVEVAHTGSITVTAVRRRAIAAIPEPGVHNFIPGEASIRVYGSSGALVNLEGFTIDDDNSGQSEGNGDGVANPGETIELDLDVKNLGRTDATRLRARLSVVSGNVLIEDDYEVIGFLAGGANIEVQDAFAVSIPAGLDENEPVQMEVNFICGQGSWESPCDFTALVDAVELPLHSIDVEYDSTGNVTTVEITNILVVNTGIGAAEGVEITLDSFSYGAVFTTCVSVVGDISPGTSAEAPSLSVSCSNPPEEWKDPYHLTMFPGCIFEIIAKDAYDREIYSEFVIVPNYDPADRPQVPPTEYFKDVEAGQDYINVEWNGPSGFDGGYYLYVKEDGASTWIRSNLLPMPVEQYTYSGLESATLFDLAVAAVDDHGQESPLCEMETPASTVCTVVEGWPIQLQGNPGSGPVSVNMDSDPDEEIVVVSSFGNVYIIKRDGSVETIPPPVSLDFDRFVSCAVGDVDNDNEEEIVVSYQVDFSNETAGLLIFDRNVFGVWNVIVVDDDIGPGEFVCAAETSNTPVLLQANDSPTLEIALRTTGSNSLYLWEWDNDTEPCHWDRSDDFPISLNCFFTPPVAVDYDEDGYDELLVADLVGGKSQIHIVDFTSNGFTESLIDLSVALGNDAKVYSSLAAAEWNGDYYLAGVAKRGTHEKKVFVYNLTGDPVPHMEWWHHAWTTGYDFYGNLGCPAIGQLNDDTEPEIAYTLVGMCGWNLLSSNEHPYTVWSENAGEMDYNHHAEYGGVPCDYKVRSATVIGGTTVQGTNIQTPFTGYSTLNYGHDPQDDMNVLPGFPTWSEDACFVAPLIIDLDSDGMMECLTSDASGLLTLYEWEGYSTSSGGWPMYQHDPWRTGFYNTQRSDGEKLDFNLLGVEEIIPESRRDDNASITLLAEVEVTGSGVSAPVLSNLRASSVPISGTPHALLVDDGLPVAERVRTSGMEIQQIRQPSADAIEYAYDSVDIALFSGNRELSSSEFPLYDGTHLIELAVPSGEEFNSDDLVARVDPGNEYAEAAEENNARAADNLVLSAPSVTRVYLRSPCESIVLNIDLLEAVPGGISIRAYSIDGRLVVEEELTELGSGSYTMELLTPGVLPAGLYTVVIEGINKEELIRSVVVLP
ncbi:MAG: hypothetical protein GQ565_13390 [Candidatus Aegiribacteria sp.]|nr:hypothetical protein [Candidatus Aegiribacteria sp.]